MMKTSLLWNILIIFMLLIIFILMTTPLHPIIMIILLICYSIMVCIILSLWKSNFIYSIIMFLIMISGLLIIFLYFSSLISNEKNKVSLRPWILTNYILNSLYLLLFIYLNKNFMSGLPMTSLEIKSILSLNINLFANIMKIYTYPFNNLTIMSILFLLISLFMIIKICSIKSAPLRKIS